MLQDKDYPKLRTTEDIHAILLDFSWKYKFKVILEQVSRKMVADDVLKLLWIQPFIDDENRMHLGPSIISDVEGFSALLCQ